MKILITEAEVEMLGSEYAVIYQGHIVYRNKLRDPCMITALNRTLLDKLSSQVVTSQLRIG